jgi:threonine dehydratase
MIEEPTLATVERIRDAVSRHARRTPLLRSEWLSAQSGSDVFLKCESLQITGSFKLRGALAALEVLSDEERSAGVVTASAGNHGLGLARAAALLGIPCTVVVPRGCPAVKVSGMERDGARIVRSPHDGFDRTQAWTLDQLGSLGGRFVSAYDDPAVIAGNGGTLMLEILEEMPPPELIVAPCGGGGLTGGIGLVARERAQETRVIGVNTEASPGMWRSLRDGRPHLEVESAPTLAEGIEGGVGELTFRLAQRVLDGVVLVSEPEIRDAIRDVLFRERLVVEGSAAAGVAALRGGRVRPAGSACVILTGSNIDSDVLRAVLGDAG